MKKKNTKKFKKPSRGKSKKKSINILNWIKTNAFFVFVLLGLAAVFTSLVQLNTPITNIDQQGLNFLNMYEYPEHNLTVDGCMEPYDVGDGVITFGPGITYATEQQGFDDLNNNFGTAYSKTNRCIEVNNLFELQKIRIEAYENIVRNIAIQRNIKFNQDQFNALVLLAYNSPNLFTDAEFITVITDDQSSFTDYVEAADGYYRELADYETKFGIGWYNRIVDSAQMYFYGDYVYQNV
ncbi:hypothetical protein RZE82_01920 [Mollicutes bacterium LVI A0039]|nr:hypothetical protein RZE82_01920 [Mollicutes bacterium LVI A0039]